MSLNVLGVDLVNEIPESFDLKEKRIYSVINGPQEFTVRTFTGQSKSNSNISITADPPSDMDLLYTTVYIEAEFEFVCKVNNAGNGQSTGLIGSATAAVKTGQDVAHMVIPRCQPLSQICGTESVNINGATFTTNLNQYNNAFMRICNDREDRAGKLSMTPSMLDELHLYSEAERTFRDPFAKYSDTILVDSRNSFVGCDYDAFGDTGDGTTAAKYGAANAVVIPATGFAYSGFRVKVIEAIRISPFSQKKALTQIKNFSYNAVLTNLGRFFCAKIPTAITAVDISFSDISVNMYSPPKLHMFVASPKLLDKIPRQLSYEHQEIQIYKTEGSDALAPNAETSFSGPVINLNSIPRRIVIWCEEKDTDATRTGTNQISLLKTDTLKASILDINVSLGNRSGLLSSATQSDLYAISRKNGLDMTYSQFSKRVGSIVILDLGIDIGLPTDLSVGVLANPLFSVTAKVKNVCPVATTFTLKYAVIYDSVMNIINGTITRQNGILSQNDVLEAQLNAPEMIADEKCLNVFGGGRIGGNPLMALLPFIQPLAKGIREGIKSPLGQTALGFLDKGMASVGMGKMKGKGKIAGGRLLSRGDLANAMYDRDM